MSLLRTSLSFLVLLFGLSAQALPDTTLYVQAVRLVENSPGPLMYVGYMELKENESERYGHQIVPMEESVADTLAALPENKMLACDARYFRNGRFAYVYSLSNCR